MMARVEIAGGKITQASFRFVRHNDANETVLCPLANESATLARLIDRGSGTGTRLEPTGEAVRIVL
jgi:hypothetical protein